MTAFYNEIDPFAADWLENLIAAGHIAPGVVDRRDIRDILPADLDGYTQCHFFAGIGGWSYALRLAGWPDDRPVWTGSCPCQPFSAAGQGGGFADERHLWPAWFHLIKECRPPVLFGEQVASPAGLAWLDLVHADLEGAGYACGMVDMGAASVGAPHIRQRLWWLGVADGRGPSSWSEAAPSVGYWRSAVATGGVDHWLGNADDTTGQQARVPRRPWIDGGADWIPCRDGKARPVEPGTFPLAHGIPSRVGRLRAYGNAIVPQVAAEFIGAYLDS